MIEIIIFCLPSFSCSQLYSYGTFLRNGCQWRGAEIVQDERGRNDGGGGGFLFSYDDEQTISARESIFWNIIHCLLVPWTLAIISKEGGVQIKMGLVRGTIIETRQAMIVHTSDSRFLSARTWLSQIKIENITQFVAPRLLDSLGATLAPKNYNYVPVRSGISQEQTLIRRKKSPIHSHATQLRLTANFPPLPVTGTWMENAVK